MKVKYSGRTLIILSVMAVDNFALTGKTNPYRGRSFIRLAKETLRLVQYRLADGIAYLVDWTLNQLVRKAEEVLSLFPSRTLWIKKTSIPVAVTIPLEVKQKIKRNKIVLVSQAAQKAAKPKAVKVGSLSIDELIALCKKKGIKANKRCKKETLLKKLGAI